MLNLGLKEWAVVCDLLLEGKLALLLRKGGIHESGGPGVFELEHPRFLLFPSWMHQKPEMVKEEFRGRVKVTASEPAEVTFRGFAEAVKIWRVTDRSPFYPGGALDRLHCWTRPQIDMRFDYKPQNPLYLMAVRVWQLTNPRTVTNHAEYAGCKSWVPLRPGYGVEEAGADTVMEDGSFDELLDRVGASLRDSR